jgi:RNA methyltransferase, TrmH family
VTRRLHIASASNHRLKAVRRLARLGAPDVLVAEGSRALRSAVDAGARIREVYSAPALHLGADDARVVALAEQRGARVIELDAAAFRTVARQIRPDGVLAVVERPETSLARLALPDAPLIVVAAAIERPGNLGTLVRTACAAGADAVLASDPRTDVFHRDVVRGSVGTIFHVQLATTRAETAVAWLRQRGIHIVAASPHASVPYWAATYGGPVAVVLGSERHGVPGVWLDAADETVAIPMCAPADSLNVGVAAGVVLFEAARLRDELARDERQLEHALVADDRHTRRRFDQVADHEALQRRDVFDGRVAERDDQIAGAQASVGGRASVDDLDDFDAAASSELAGDARG